MGGCKQQAKHSVLWRCERNETRSLFKKPPGQRPGLGLSPEGSQCGGGSFYSGWIRWDRPISEDETEFGRGEKTQTDSIRTFRDKSQCSQPISKRDDAELARSSRRQIAAGVTTDLG